MALSKDFTEGEFYQAHFNSRVYVNTFYSQPQGHSEEKNFLTFVFESLSKTFSKGQYKGKRLIEVGSGPTIHAVLSACHHYDELLLSDYTDSNLAEINKWLQNEEGCFNWKPIIEYVCKIEGRSPSDVEAKLRQKVKVLKCDVRLENLFHPQTIEPADCIITSLCLEAACKDMQTYRDALGRVAKMLLPGGVLVMIGVFGETFYDVDNTRFSCLKISKEDIQKTLNNLGLTIQELNVLPAEDRDSNTVSDFEAVFYLVALKSARSA